MRKPLLLLISVLLACWLPCLSHTYAAFQEKKVPMPDYEGKVNAPDFPEGMEWLNTDRPLSLRQLRGKVVLLDFWTYCCINCMHVIPDLKRLEKKYADELVVIGVHSAKFNGERETQNIRQAILRYEIEHPVINDYKMEVWQSYAVRSWPTLMLIDPAGKVLGYLSGEGIYEAFDKLIARVIEEFDAKKQIDRRPLALRLERSLTPTSMLAFPGKVLADEKSKQLFIADSSHNRIVVVSISDSSVKEVIGTGEIGMNDAGFEGSTFNHPQGMAFDGHVLYVADTENHAIRAVDFDKRTVATIAGTGTQSRKIDQLGGQGKQTPLNSPWDLVLNDGMLYIAMAGPHQLWRMNPKTGGVVPYAGTGREDRIDGPLDRAALAQPSGITTDGKKLYFADSEVSSIRSADLNPDGVVETIVGEGLFEFGDRDGKGSVVRLQHPLGVVYHDGAVYVADTYNNKIKVVSPKDKSSQTFLGSGEGGLRDGDRATFDEPGGLSVAHGKLYIADTNNHSIRVADLKSRRVETLQLKGLEKLRPRAKVQRFAGQTIEVPEQSVEPGEASLTLQLQLPPGFKLNPQAPSAVTVEAGGGEQTFRNPKFPLTVPVKISEGEAVVKADFVLYYCETEKESLCYFKEARLSLAVKAMKGASNHGLSATYKFGH
ncbi:MAG TPA: thioredoxin-like domain-containing protein [Blastocatellia bacterium]|jgi:thiol-disulfide isomerase/thioredoxin|nr:thioredoxin-like domain-containing protein [Blastocatellia bacterium]